MQPAGATGSEFNLKLVLYYCTTRAVVLLNTAGPYYRDRRRTQAIELGVSTVQFSGRLYAGAPKAR